MVRSVNFWLAKPSGTLRGTAPLLTYFGLRTFCLAAVLGMVAVKPAAAFDLFGLKLFEGQKQADEAAVISDPQPYSLGFSTSGATGDLDAAIRGASSLLAGKDTPASGTPGLLAMARSARPWRS